MARGFSRGGGGGGRSGGSGGGFSFGGGGAAQEVQEEALVSALEVQAVHQVQEIMAGDTVVDIIITITDVQEDLGMFQCLEERLLFQQGHNHSFHSL